MFFTQKQVNRLVAGKPVQIRKLTTPTQTWMNFAGENTVYDGNPKSKVKWQVGRDYAVQLDVLESGLWYCTECLKCISTNKEIIKKYGDMGSCQGSHYEVRFFQPLRIKITGIFCDKNEWIIEGVEK